MILMYVHSIKYTSLTVLETNINKHVYCMYTYDGSTYGILFKSFEGTHLKKGTVPSRIINK